MFETIFLIILWLLLPIPIWYHWSLHIKSCKFHKEWDKMTPKQQIVILESLKTEDEKAKFINIYYGRLWK